MRNKYRLINAFLISLLLAAPAPAATVFMETPDATRGKNFWIGSQGTVVYDSTTPTKSGIASWKAGDPSLDTTNNLLAPVGSSARISAYFRIADLPTTTGRLFEVTGDLNENFRILITSSGVLQLEGSADGQIGANGPTLSTATWYRIAWAFTSTSHKVFVDGSQVISGSATQTSDGTGLETGYFLQGANKFLNFQHVYIDDAASLDDPGDIRVTAKRPAANNTNNFDTAIGANPANRWTNVNEEPLSTTNGWEHDAATDVQENYGLETAGAGDVDITGATIVARQAWLYSSRDNGSASGSCTGSTTGTTCVTGSFQVRQNEMAVCVFGDRVAGSAPTIADTLGNTWTLLTGATSTIRTTAWGSPITVGGSTAVTFTFGSSAAKRAGVCASYHSPITSVPQDKNPAAATDGTSPYTSTTSGTLAQANEIVVGYLCTSRPSSDTYAAGTGYTDSSGFIGTTGGNDVTCELEHQIVTATTSLTATWTDSTNGASVEGIVTFKQQTPTGSGAPKIMDNGTESSITLTTSPAIYSILTDSASYPSNAAGIGARSSNSGTAIFLYEAGTMIAYIPAALGGANYFPRRPFRGGP